MRWHACTSRHVALHVPTCCWCDERVTSDVCHLHESTEQLHLLVGCARLRTAAVGEEELTLSDAAIRKAATSNDLALHCRRKTSGTDATVRTLENVLMSLSGATDSLGVPLLKNNMADIWAEQP